MKRFYKRLGISILTAALFLGLYANTARAESVVWTNLLTSYKEDASVNQLIFVKYKKKAAADVVMYQKENGIWKCILSCKAYVGKKGINKKKEGDVKTPTGTYTVTGAFGIKANPGAKLPYTKVNKYLYLCGDKKYYNKLIDIRTCPHKCKGEKLIKFKPQYNYGLFLDYNKDCVYKKGSAIFMHCMGSKKYTAGCIAVSKANMIKIIRNADKNAKICIYNK